MRTRNDWGTTLHRRDKGVQGFETEKPGQGARNQIAVPDEFPQPATVRQVGFHGSHAPGLQALKRSCVGVGGNNAVLAV